MNSFLDEFKRAADEQAEAFERYKDEPIVYYANCGSGVHPRCVSGIELDDTDIRLIKWWVCPDSKGRLNIRRAILDGHPMSTDR